MKAKQRPNEKASGSLGVPNLSAVGGDGPDAVCILVIIGHEQAKRTPAKPNDCRCTGWALVSHAQRCNLAAVGRLAYFNLTGSNTGRSSRTADD